MSDCWVSLSTKNTLVTEIRDMFSKPPDGTFDFIGKFHWVEKARNFFFVVHLKKNIIPVLRELVDQVQEEVKIIFPSVKLGSHYGLWLSTLPSTKIDLSDKEMIFCSPFFDSKLVNIFYELRSAARRTIRR